MQDVVIWLPTAGVGSSVTVSWKLEPAQAAGAAERGVTVNTISTGEVVLLTKVGLKEGCPVFCVLPPEVMAPGTELANQV